MIKLVKQTDPGERLPGPRIGASRPPKMEAERIGATRHPDHSQARHMIEPKSKVFRRRCGNSIIRNFYEGNQNGESARKLRFRLNRLDQSISSRRYKDSYASFHKEQPDISGKFISNRSLRRVNKLLYGGLMISQVRVGIHLSQGIQMVVKPLSRLVIGKILPRLHTYASSYTSSTIRRVASILNYSRMALVARDL